MPTIQLTDNASLNITGSSADGGSSLNRYLKSSLTFKPREALDRIAALEIGQLDPDSFPLNFSAATGAAFEAGDASLAVQAGASAKIGLLAGDDRDGFLDSLQLPAALADSAILSFGLTGSVSAGPQGSTSEFSFGLVSGASATVTNYCRAAGGDPFLQVAERAVAGFFVPHDVQDLDRLAEGAICRVDGASSLQFSASVTHNFVNDALATVPLPVLPALQLNAEASATVQVTVTHSADHRVTLAKLPGGRIHLSVSATSTDDFDTSLEVSSGVSGQIGHTDGLEFLLKTISPNSTAEIKKLRTALPADQAGSLGADFKSAIDATLSHSFKASLKAELDRSEESKRIFLYEIDLTALNEDGRKAVEAALRGDFKAITVPGAALPGVRELHSALTLSSQTVHTFALHLLGIFNTGSTETFLRQAKINYTKDTREIVLSDEKIEVTDNNLKAEKLREVLLKAVTLTLPAGANTPDSEITLNMVFFDRHAGTNASQLRQFVNVLQAMGAPDAAGAAGLFSRNLRNWGATTLYLGLNLDKKLNSALFRRANGQPWRRNDYLLQARDAMATILANDPDSAARRKLFTLDLSFWDTLRAAGSGANVTRLLAQNGIPATSVTDFFAMDWWAGSMAKYAEALASGSSLEAAGKQIVKTSGGGFNEPWALYAVWALLENPEVTARFTCSIPMATPAAQAPRSS